MIDSSTQFPNNSAKTKTGQRRLVPILPNLAGWLAPYVQKSGRVWVYGDSYLSHLKQQVAEKAGIKWKHNALRHSPANSRRACHSCRER